MDQVYLNGAYKPLNEACVPVLDRGFLFGDGVYEVIPVYSGKPFRVEQHLQRLQRSLDGIRLRNPLSSAEWRSVIDGLIERNTGDADAAIYIQITRGVMERRDHGFGDDLEPTVLLTCQAMNYPLQQSDTAGGRAITLEDSRWQDCHIKSINLLPNVLLRQQALDAGADEAILIRDGKAIEGAGSNLFIVKDEVIKTPPRQRCMLGGITRDLILELCAGNHLLAREIDISEDELHDADEIWMTSSTREILPITVLNQHKVGKGETGAMWREVIRLYQDYKQQVMRG
jgi:D-alanine transaminase